MLDLKCSTRLPRPAVCPGGSGVQQTIPYGPSISAGVESFPAPCRASAYSLPAPHTLPTTIAEARSGVSEA